MSLLPPPPGQQKPLTFTLPTGPSQVSTVAPKVLLYAVPGWGKTTLAFYAPNPYMLSHVRETGYDHLTASGQEKPIMQTTIDSWKTLVQAVTAVASAKHIDSLWLDCLGMFQQLCEEHVRNTEFNGSPSEYQSYSKGDARTLQVWNELLIALDNVTRAGKMVVMLSHCSVKNHKNPMGSDYDRYIPSANEKVAAATAAWASDVLFGSYETAVSKDGKAMGGKSRIVKASEEAGFVAKSQRGVPPFILVGDDKRAGYEKVFGSLFNKKGKQ
jgi:hypothetical protein